MQKAVSNPTVHILLIVVVLILTAGALSPTLRNQFVNNWDDEKHLLINEHARSLEAANIKNMFTSLVEGTYIPLTVLSYAVEYRFYKYDPFGYHLTNLILHLMITALVYRLAVVLGLDVLAAALAALVFGIHPMHVESAAWVTERKDLLYSVFYLASVLLYLRYLDKRSRAAYACSLVCCALSILAKSMALSLPLVLWIMDWFKRRDMTARMVWDKILYFCVIVPVAWITYINNADTLKPNTDVLRSGLLYVWSFSHYLKKFFWPVGFSPVNEVAEPITLSNGTYLLAFVIFIAVGVLLVLRKNDRLFIFAVAYYFASIFFLLRMNIVVFSAQMVSDRFMYLPSVGFCLWLAHVFYKSGIENKNKILSSSALVLIAGLIVWSGIASFKQSQIWKNEETLWRHALKFYPESSVANNNLADYLLKKGVVNQEVVGLCRQAIATYSNYPNAYVNLGSALAQLGDVKEAAQHFRKAISLDPDHVVAHANLATALMQLGDRAQAAQHAKKAIDLGFDQPDIHRIMKWGQ